MGPLQLVGAQSIAEDAVHLEGVLQRYYDRVDNVQVSPDELYFEQPAGVEVGNAKVALGSKGHFIDLT